MPQQMKGCPKGAPAGGRLQRCTARPRAGLGSRSRQRRRRRWRKWCRGKQRRSSRRRCGRGRGQLRRRRRLPRPRKVGRGDELERWRCHKRHRRNKESLRRRLRGRVRGLARRRQLQRLRCAIGAKTGGLQRLLHQCGRGPHGLHARHPMWKIAAVRAQHVGWPYARRRHWPHHAMRPPWAAGTRQRGTRPKAWRPLERSRRRSRRRSRESGHGHASRAGRATIDHGAPIVGVPGAQHAGGGGHDAKLDAHAAHHELRHLPHLGGVWRPTWMHHVGLQATLPM